MEKEGRGTVNNCAHTWTAYVASLARKCHDGSPFLISCCASKKTVGNAFLLHSDKNIQCFILLKYYPLQESITKFKTITLFLYIFIIYYSLKRKQRIMKFMLSKFNLFFIIIEETLKLFFKFTYQINIINIIHILIILLI